MKDQQHHVELHLVLQRVVYADNNDEARRLVELDAERLLYASRGVRRVQVYKAIVGLGDTAPPTPVPLPSLISVGPRLGLWARLRTWVLR